MVDYEYDVRKLLATAVAVNGLTEKLVTKRVLTLRGWKIKVRAIEVYDGDVLVTRVKGGSGIEIMRGIYAIKEYVLGLQGRVPTNPF